MRRRIDVFRPIATGGLLPSCLQQGQRRTIVRDHFDFHKTGNVDLAPRAEQDITLKDPEQQVLPGAHPLPLSNEFMERQPWPLVSPYMPNSQRVHPYWTSPPEELPCFDATQPVLRPKGSIVEDIYVPVHDLTGAVTHTRRLDNAVFGQYPHNEAIQKCHTYWQIRTQDYAAQWDFDRVEIFRKRKKNWPSTGTGMGRVSDRKNPEYPWGSHLNGIKPWRYLMPHMDPVEWHTGNRQMLTTKLLQGKLMVVDRLTLPEPTTEAFEELCASMRWDVRHDGAGVLFMDGGSRIAPSMEFDSNFFYGSFYNGRCKVVRPTILADQSIDPLRDRGRHPNFYGPMGSKNPIPINRFNCFDALEHHLLVVTEGALAQMEEEVFPLTVESLPPHIRAQLPEVGVLGNHLIGTRRMENESMEYEAYGRMEEVQKSMYEPFYDNPYKPWPDENNAAYEVDVVDGYIKRHVIPDAADAADGNPEAKETAIPGSWRVLE